MVGVGVMVVRGGRGCIGYCTGDTAYTGWIDAGGGNGAAAGDGGSDADDDRDRFRVLFVCRWVLVLGSSSGEAHYGGSGCG